MIVHVLGLVGLLGGFYTINGDSVSDPQRCISGDEKNLPVIRKQHCLVTKEDVKLTCSPNQVVVLMSLKLGVKNNSGGACMKRILTDSDEFCCNLEDSDVLYDGHCLKDVWNTEDKNHYQSFVKTALQRCTNTSQCVLQSHMFANLQTEIPISMTHSSYFQVLYKCIAATPMPVNPCSPVTMIGKEVFFQGRFAPGELTNKTCTCRVTSQTDDNITVRAVDVRTSHSGLVLSSEGRSSNFSYSQMPNFGFREMFTDQKFQMSLTLGATTSSENIWLHVSGSNGKDVNVTCGETTVKDEVTSTLPGRMLTVHQEAVIWEYWPLIYVAAGSIFTFLIVACILCGVLICRRMKKKRHPCGHPHLPSPADFHQDPFAPPYATVLDDTLSRSDSRMSSIYDKPYGRGYSRSTSMKSVRPPMAPPPPPPNGPGRNLDASNACNVSELEAFLECKEPNQRLQGISTIHSSAQSYQPQHRFRQLSRLDSGFSDLSYSRSTSRVGYDPRSDPSSPNIGTVFDGEGSITDYLLAKITSPTEAPVKDVSGDHGDVTQSLLLDHNDSHGRHKDSESTIGQITV